MSDYKSRQMKFEDNAWQNYNLQPRQQTPAQIFYSEFEYGAALKLLNSVTDIDNFKTLLVCGVGGGADLHFWLTHCSFRSVSAVDFSIEALKASERRIHFNDLPKIVNFVNADFENIPFASFSFDAVICVYSLHHALHPEDCVREMWRVARKAVVVLEPLATPVTRLFARIGLAKEEEEVGNTVLRFTMRDFLSWIGPDCKSYVSRSIFAYYHRSIYNLLLRALNSDYALKIFKSLYTLSSYFLFPFRSKLIIVLLKDRY